jgi:putative ABC transport system substrate-binding protein
MPRPRPAVSSAAITLFLMLAFAGPGPAPGDDLSRLEGVVADAAGRPLEAASVSLRGEGMQPATVVTAADGSFRFWGLKPVSGYRIAAAKPGYRTIEYDGMRLESGRRRTIRFRLKRPDERDAVVLASRDPFPYAEVVSGFLDGLSVPARVIDLDAELDPAEAVRHVAAEKPNVILAAGLRAGRLVRSEVRDIPSILTLIDDPRQYDLAAANICFLANNADPADVVGRLEALLPHARRIGLLYDADRSMLLARDIMAAAEARGLEVQLQPCYAPAHVREALADLVDRIDVLLVPYDPLAVAPVAMNTIIGWGLRHRVAVIASQAEWMRHGALLSYGVPLEHLGAQAREMAEELLSGSRHPEDIGVRLPLGPVLEINRTTASTIGVSLPEPE